MVLETKRSAVRKRAGRKSVRIESALVRQDLDVARASARKTDIA